MNRIEFCSCFFVLVTHTLPQIYRGCSQTPIELLHQSLVIFQLKTRFSIFPFFTWLHFTALTVGAVWSPALFSGTWCLTGEDEFYGDTTKSVIAFSKCDLQRGVMAGSSVVTGARYWFCLWWDFSAPSLIHPSWSKCFTGWTTSVCSHFQFFLCVFNDLLPTRFQICSNGGTCHVQNLWRKHSHDLPNTGPWPEAGFWLLNQLCLSWLFVPDVDTLLTHSWHTFSWW